MEDKGIYDRQVPHALIYYQGKLSTQYIVEVKRPRIFAVQGSRS